MSKIVKNKILTASILSMLFVFTSFILIAPKIIAPPPTPPDQFIGEILPNQTLTLNLLNSNVFITINSTNYPDTIGIEFNANYTIYNPENDTNLSLVLPFSLGIQINESNFNVKLNETQIEFNLYNFTDGSINNTDYELDFISIFLIHNPIILIRCNFTALENKSYIIGYKFRGYMNHPLISRDFLFLTYYLNTSKTWNGNTTGRVEFRVHGKVPIFSTMGTFLGDVYPQIFDIIEGKSCIWEWANIRVDMVAIGIVYDERYYPYPGIWDIIYSIIVSVVFSIIIVSIIIFFIARRKSRKIT